MVDAYGGLPQCGNDLAIDDILFTACTPSASVTFSTTSSICSGTNTSISASIINNPFTTPAYQWQKSTDGGNTWINIGTPGNSASTYILNNVSSADQASYRVLVGPDVASLGSSTCITASAPVSLTVYASPAASAGSNSPVCSGSAINLSSIVTGGTSPYSYSWTGPNSFNSTVAYPSITNSALTNGGIYQFQVTDNNGCKANASTNVIVNEKPVVDPIIGDSKGCVGSSFYLSSSTPNGTWSSINTSVATVDQSGMVTLIGSGSSFITYRVIENGCTTAVIKPVTAASVAIAQDVIECNNGVRSYTNNATDPYYIGYSNTNSGNSYLWTITNTGTGLVENAVYKSGTDQNSLYPSVQLPNGNVYQIKIQFTTNGITCSAEHTVYKQIQLSGSITSAQDTTVCANATNIPLKASTSVVANSLNWRTLNGSGIFSSTNTLITNYTPSAADIASGTIFIVFEAATTLNMNGNCGSSMVSDTMALHILPVNNGISTVSTICSGSSFQYTPTSSIAGSSFIWTSLVLSGTGSGNGTNGSGAIQNTLVNLSGTLDFIVRYNITPIYNGCNGTPFTVTVTVKPLPTINITNNATEICSGAISNIVFNSSISNTQYTWTSDILAGTATGASSNNTTSTIYTITDVINNTNTANAIIRYNITGISSDGCTNTASTNLTVYASPGNADAGPDQQLCNTTVTTLNAVAPTAGSGTWSLVSGPSVIIFVDPTQHNTTVSGLTTGSYTLKWKITNGACSSSEDFVQINVSAATNPGILSADTSVCASGNNGTLVLSGFSGSIIHSEFSTNNGLNWNILNNSTGLSSINYNNLTTTTKYRTLVQNGTCSSSYSNTVTITVFQSVSLANAGTDTILCGAVSAVLNANQPISGMGIWTQIGGPNNANFITANAYNSTANGLIPGTYTFRWTISNGVCTTSDDDVTVQVTAPLVNMIINKNYTVCEGQSVTILADTASGGNGIYQYQWQETKDGINWTDIPGANTIQYIFTPSATTASFRRMVKSGLCSQFSNVVMVAMQAAVSNNHLPAITYVCKDSSILITGSQPSGGDGLYTYRWESSIDNGTSWATITGATGKDYVAGFISNNTLFRRIVSTTHCTGAQESISNSSSVIIKFKPIAAYTILPDSGCSPVMVHFSNQSTGNNAVYHYNFGDGRDTLLNTLSAISHLYKSNTLVTLYTTLSATNECGTDSIAKKIIIKPDHIQPDLRLSDSSLCGTGSIIFTNNTKGALKYSWNFGDGTQVMQTSSNSIITHTYTQPGTYLFTLTADNGCSIQSIQHTIRIHPAPVAAFTIPEPDFCVGDSVRLENQSIHASEYRWLLGNSDTSKAISPVTLYKNEGLFNIILVAGNTYPEYNKSCFDTTKKSISILDSRKGSMQVNKLSDKCLPYSIEAFSLNAPVSEVIWNWGNDSISKGEKVRYQYFTNGQYQITMTATNAGGCRFIDSTTVHVNSPSGTFKVADKDICIGQTVSFSLDIINNTFNPQDSIRWYPGDGTVETKALGNFSYQYAKAGVFYPKAWLLKAGGCLIPLITTDSVRVDQVISKFGLSGVFECGTTTYQFIDSSKAALGIRSWKWVMNGRDSTYERIRVSRFNQKGTHTTTLVVEGNTGCTATSQANFDVQVYQYPVASISAMAEACKTDLLELKSSINSQDSVALRLWTLGNGFSAQDSIIKATFASDGTYNIKLTVATVNNCFDSVYKQVTVHPLPNISVQQNNIVCRGDSITIRANGASRFIWKDQQENIICTDCAEIKVKPGSSTGYKVIGYNQFGCSEIKSTSVRVINPIKMIASTGDTVCAGESSHLSATGAAAYQWLPIGTFNGSSSSSINVRPSETTIYKVVGKDAYNCFSDTSEVKVVVGKPTPVTLGKDTTIISGVPYNLRLQSSVNDIVKWRWSGAPGISCATCPTPVVKLSDDACITCTAVNQFGCISSDTICIKTFCPTTEVFVPNAFTPDGDGINDKLIVQGKGIRLIKSFRIFNRWGEVVFEKVNFNPGDPAYGWDGKIKGNIASPDVYVYVCEVICEKGLPSIFKGNTAILK